MCTPFQNEIKEYSQKLALKQKKHYRIAENRMVRVWLNMVMYGIKFNANIQKASENIIDYTLVYKSY